MNGEMCLFAGGSGARDGAQTAAHVVFKEKHNGDH